MYLMNGHFLGSNKDQFGDFNRISDKAIRMPYQTIVIEKLRTIVDISTV